jgi:hypothetical protein
MVEQKVKEIMRCSVNRRTVAMSKIFKAPPQSGDYAYNVTARKKPGAAWKGSRIFASS